MHVVTRSEPGTVLVLAEDWGQPANLGTESCSDMLRLIRNQLLYTRHDLIQEGLAFQQRAEAYFT